LALKFGDRHPYSRGIPIRPCNGMSRRKAARDFFILATESRFVRFPPMNFFALTSIVSSVLGLILEGTVLYAAILFFKADRRLHTWFLLIGAAGSLLARLFSAVIFSAFFASRLSGGQNIQSVFAVQSGISLIFAAMFAYGLVSVALIHYRKAQVSEIDP
jgi:hypothetical protein